MNTPSELKKAAEQKIKTILETLIKDTGLNISKVEIWQCHPTNEIEATIYMHL